MSPHRFAVIAAVALATLAPAASSAPSPRLTVPPQTRQGQIVTIDVAVKSRTRCFLQVLYANGSGEAPGAAVSRLGHARWHWRVAPTAALGKARALVSCGAAGRTSASFNVAGPLEKLKILIANQGFSQRTTPSGSTLSYGIMLKNPSHQQEALDTFVLVNFVDSTGRALGSSSKRVKLIGAEDTYALGDSIELRTATPVANLEITIQMGTVRPKTVHILPALQNLAILPSRFEPAWVSEVDGELVNDEETLTLARASLSIVLFDAEGQVVGGGTGSTTLSIPAGSRAVFTAHSGFRGVPLAKAATATVSIEPTYAVT